MKIFRLYLVPIFVLLGACGAMTNVRVTVVSGNESKQSTVVTLINRGEEGPDLGPGGTAELHPRIAVASSNGNGGYTTAPIDKTTTIGVSYRIRSTGQITDEVPCQAGSKLVTHAAYRVYGTPPYQYAQVDCWTAYTSGDRIPMDSISYKVKIRQEVSDSALPEYR